MSNVPCTENSIGLDQVNKEAAPKIERFLKVISGNDHGELMYLPPAIASIMEPLTGQQFIIKDVEGCLWPVLLSRKDGDLAFTNGWVPFFRHHNLEEFSMLNFEYEDGSNSLFVRVYEKTGREALSNKRAANSVQASDETISHEGTQVNETTSPCKLSPDSSNERLVDSDLETSVDEIIEADQLPSAYSEVTSPVERCELMDKLDNLEKHYGSETNVEWIKNLGFKESEGVKRKSNALAEEAMNSVGGHLDKHQQKRPAFEQPMSKMGHVLPKSQEIDIRQSNSAASITVDEETSEYMELPIHPGTTLVDQKQVVYLKDPKGKVWPFVNGDNDRRSVKMPTDKWKEFCDENDIVDMADCLFEVEEADLGIYGVHVASRGSAD